jgi:glycosyltransferase involved in cell wall biosynthesis
MKFSITIPIYKATFLKECIESVLSQTYKDFEVIIVNDASPEDLTSIVKSFDDSRIKYYVNEKNCGAINVVDNWNKCLSYATGDYIICMGDDDKLLPSCLEEYVKLIETYPGLGVYHAWTELIDENSCVINMQEARPLYEKVYSMMWERWKSRLQYIGDFLFDRKLLINNGGFFKLPLAWASDDLSAYIAAQKNGIANMQVPGFQYRINSKTITNTSNAEIKLEAINMEEQWYREFLAKEPKENDVIEKIFWLMCKKNLIKMMTKKRIYTISEDLANKGLDHIFKYVWQRKHNHLNLKMLSYAFIEAVKRRMTKKI